MRSSTGVVRKRKIGHVANVVYFVDLLIVLKKKDALQLKSLGFCPTKIWQKAFTWDKVEATLDQIQTEAHYLDRNDISMSFPPY